MDAGDHQRLVRAAVELACESARTRGGPFGALVARAGTVLATGTNRVTVDADPTAHAEVVAIRAAARALASHDLSGCVLYASCEPCPMCGGAVLWSRIEAVWYAADREQAAAAGFDDRRFHDDLARPPQLRTPPARRVLAEAGGEPFAIWLADEERVRY